MKPSHLLYAKHVTIKIALNYYEGARTAYGEPTYRALRFPRLRWWRERSCVPCTVSTTLLNSHKRNSSWLSVIDKISTQAFSNSSLSAFWFKPVGFKFSSLVFSALKALHFQHWFLKVAHDELDIMGALQTERLPQRQRKEEEPKSRRALIDWPIDSRVAALTNATGCSQATWNVHAQRGLFAGEGVHKAHFLHGCMDNFNARLHVQDLFMPAKWATSGLHGDGKFKGAAITWAADSKARGAALEDLRLGKG